MSVFLILFQICSHRCTIGTIGTMEFGNLNFGTFGLVWLGLHGNGAKNVRFIHQNTQKWNGLERNQMVFKEPYMSLTLTVLLVFLIKTRSNELEINPRSSPFAMCLPCGAKMAEKCRGFDLTDYLCLDIH